MIIGIAYSFAFNEISLGIVLPLMECDLDSVIKKKLSFSLQNRLNIASQIVCGLRYMHYRKFSHNDIKPQNILLSFDMKNKDPQVYISDFGTMIRAKENKFNLNAITMEYASPESILSFKFSHLLDPDNSPGDVWSLGLVLYKLLLCTHDKSCPNLQFPWKPYLKNKNDEEEINDKLKNTILELLSSQNNERNEFLNIKENQDVPSDAEKLLRKLINDCLQVKRENRINAEDLYKTLKDIEDLIR